MQIFTVSCDTHSKTFKTYEESIIYGKTLSNFKIFVEEFDDDFERNAIKVDLNVNGIELFDVKQHY